MMTPKAWEWHTQDSQEAVGRLIVVAKQIIGEKTLSMESYVKLVAVVEKIDALKREIGEAV